jgi:membrane protease YdiL (CAAX protease family)
MIVIPIVILMSVILLKLREKRKFIVIIILSILLFIVRFALILFQETIGIMPNLVEDIVFYGLLMVFGICFTLAFTFKVEKVSLEEIGGKVESVKKSILYGLLGFIPLISLFPVIIFLADIQISPIITLGKIFVGFSFAMLGAVYEEIFFRGIIQNRFSEITNDNQLKTIIFTALTFTATHIFYLPLTGFGIYYIFVFVMAIVLSILRIKCDLLACAINHGGIVFILIILS